MTRTRPSTLVILGIIGGVAGFLLQFVLAAMSQPKLRPEYPLALSLLLIAAIVIALAIPVRRAVRGANRHPVDPFYATRVVLLAKAASLCGVLIGGFGAGLLIEMFVRSSSATVGSYLQTAAVLAGGVLLLVAGLIAEWLCTLPPRDDDDEHRGEPEHVRL